VSLINSLPRLVQFCSILSSAGSHAGILAWGGRDVILTATCNMLFVAVLYFDHTRKKEQPHEIVAAKLVYFAWGESPFCHTHCKGGVFPFRVHYNNIVNAPCCRAVSVHCSTL
jgi:hypothetical protein